MKLYLHQFLSSTGKFQSKADLISSIRNGEIKVSNVVVTNPMYNFNPNKKRVYWDSVMLKPLKKKVYIAVNKPEGYLSSRLAGNDKKLGKKSVFDLISPAAIDSALEKTLFCVGRLDEDSSGLLLITNDGNLSHEITNPDSRTKKTYDVLLRQPISENEIAELEKGIEINLEENGIVAKYKTKGCRITAFPSGKHLQIILTEGKKREIRRMFEKIGNKVLRLQRIAIGTLNLEGLKLKKGEFTFVEEDTIKQSILNG